MTRVSCLLLPWCARWTRELHGQQSYFITICNEGYITISIWENMICLKRLLRPIGEGVAAPATSPMNPPLFKITMHQNPLITNIDLRWSAPQQHLFTSCKSQWSSGSTLACGTRDPWLESRCGQKFVFSRKSLQYAALDMGCTLTAVSRSTQPSTLQGTVNEYQPCVIHGTGWMFSL